MPLILFPLASAFRNRDVLNLGVPPWGQKMPLPGMQYLITGVTKDSTGAVIGGCVVHLFRTADDIEVDILNSDAVTGAFTFTSASPTTTYYIVAYKVGAPDVSGTTVNTLVGVA